jgi:hypothetical protein
VSPDVEHAIITFCGALRVAQRLSSSADRTEFVAAALPIFEKGFSAEVAVLAAEEITAREPEQWARS